MSEKHSVDRLRAIDRTTTTVVGGLGKLNLPQRAETALGVTDHAVGAAAGHVDRTTQAATQTAQAAQQMATGYAAHAAGTTGGAAAASSARAAAASFTSAANDVAAAAGNVTGAGLSATSGALNAGRAAITGAQSATSAAAVVARPLASNVRMGMDVVSTLQAGEDDDGVLVKQGLVGDPSRFITNRFLPPSMRRSPLGTAPRLAKHVTVDVVKSTITSYRDAKAALTQGKEAARQAARAGRAVGSTVTQTAKAGQNLMRGTRAATSGTGQATRAAVHGTKPAARAAGRVLSKTGTMVVRGAQAAVAAIRAAIGAVVAVFSSTSPLVIAIVAIISVLVLIFTWFGWLLPNLIEKSEHPEQGQYGVAPPGPWGGHENGKIPEDELTEIPFAPGFFLRSDAVAQLVLMNEAYRKEFGVNIVVVDTYRDYAGQVEQRELWCARGSCGNAAPPGTSNHGWALAGDFGGPLYEWDSPEHDWMEEHAAEYGYINPDWAAPDLKNEPWHWDFWGVEGGGDGSNPSAEGDAQEYARGRVVDDDYYGLTLDGPDGQWACLKTLWTGESNWNHLAENPDSRAYGIPQALPGDKMATFGDDWATNYETQIEWGLDYIKSRYETPCLALAFWNSKDPHWY